MRLAVISDIHGNMEALQAVLADMDRELPDAVYCLGDSIGYGPEPGPVMRELRRRKVPVVRGNHELAVQRREYLDWFNPIARRSLEKTIALLDADDKDYVGQLPPYLSAHGCRFVHGFPPRSALIYQFQVTDAKKARIMTRLDERICFIGHTHTLELFAFLGDRLSARKRLEGSQQLDPGRKYLVNVGSVGQPRDGDFRAKYVLLHVGENRIDTRCVSYDAEATVAKMRSAGWPPQHAARLVPTAG